MTVLDLAAFPPDLEGPPPEHRLPGGVGQVGA